MNTFDSILQKAYPFVDHVYMAVKMHPEPHIAPYSELTSRTDPAVPTDVERLEEVIEAATPEQINSSTFEYVKDYYNWVKAGKPRNPEAEY